MSTSISRCIRKIVPCSNAFLIWASGTPAPSLSLSLSLEFFFLFVDTEELFPSTTC